MATITSALARSAMKCWAAAGMFLSASPNTKKLGFLYATPKVASVVPTAWSKP